MIVFISPDTAGTARILRLLDDQQPSHHFDDEEPQISDVVRYLEKHDVATVVVGPALDRQVTSDFVGEIAGLFPFVGVLAFVDDDPETMRSAFRLGATDVVSFDADDAEVVSVLGEIEDRMVTRRASGGVRVNDAGPRHRVITAVSPRGGVGRTVVAAGLASTLERKVPGEVVLVDLDLQCGDIAPLLGLAPLQTLGSLAGRESDIDSADVKAALSTDETGLHVMAAPATLTASVEVSPELVTSVISLLSASFRYVVIDTGPYFSEPTVAAIDLSSDLLLIGAPDVPSVRAVARANDALDQLGVVAAHRHLVINRATERYGMPIRDIEAITGCEAVSQVASSRELALTLNQGTSFHAALQRRTVLHKAMSTLTQVIEPTLGSAGRRRGLRRAV